MTRIITGDCRDVLDTLEDQSVHCCITSPPYWGLRDYGVEGQIGMEDSFQDFISTLVDVFRKVRRVLRDDGTCWVNMGDSYASQGGRGVQGEAGEGASRAASKAGARERRRSQKPPKGFKRKDMMGQPWRLAFALQEDGWYLRQDIIWNKKNPMPSSAKDRFTVSHEYIFLLSKNPCYYFDQDAVKEPSVTPGASSIKSPDGWDTSTGAGGHGSFHKKGREKGARKSVAKGGFKGKYDTIMGREVFRAVNEMRNKRSVWTISTKPYKEAHFATFPPDLIRPCVLAGCPVGGTILDPFGGSGTTGLVAEEEGRNCILIEMNPEFSELAKKRTAQMGLVYKEAEGKHETTQ